MAAWRWEKWADLERKGGVKGDCWMLGVSNGEAGGMGKMQEGEEI